MSLNQNNIISNNILENSIKEVINNTNFINNLAMRINNINKSNLINRNIPEDELLPPSDFKKESLNKKKDIIKNKGLSDDEENNIFNEFPNKYILYIQENKDKNKKIYTYYKEHGFTYDLRYKDRNCEGRAQFDLTDKIIKITQDCSIEYNEHNYIKEKLFSEKIEKNNVSENENFISNTCI